MVKIVTKEEFLNRVNNRDSNIEVLGEYVNCQHPVLCRCKIDGHEWMANAAHLMYDRGCPVCGRRNAGLSRAVTREEFEKRLSLVNKDIVIIGGYKNTRTRVECECLKDGKRWFAFPSNLLKGEGCPKCGVEIRAEKRRRTQDEFESILYKLNPSIQVLGKYIDSQTKISVKCMVDEHEWDALPNNLLKGEGCPKCYERRKPEITLMSNEEFLSRLKNESPHIKPLEAYRGMNKRILCLCMKHDVEWQITPGHLLRGQGCHKCRGEKIRGKLIKSHNAFCEELKEKHPNIVPVEQYNGQLNKIHIKCLDCGYVWSSYPSNLFKVAGCPVCSMSRGEKRIAEWLKQNGFTYRYEKSFRNLRGEKGRPLSYDFYVYKHKLLIEYNGEQHYRPIDFDGLGKDHAASDFYQQLVHDQRKFDYAQEHGYPLLIIPYTEYDNVETILNDFIISLNDTVV